MDLAAITPMLLTYNEAPNIARTLDKLAWARQILVIDSGSTDDTLAIVARYGQAQVVHRGFDDFAGQCNFGLSRITTPWVLSLDADYELSDALIAELRTLAPGDRINGYRAGFIYRMFGHALRGTLYPPRTVLYRAATGRYRNEGHGHRAVIDGAVQNLAARIYHDDRKPLARWLASQQRYAELEVDHLLSADPRELRRTDRIRLLGWPAPPLVFIYTLLVKGCLLDGWPGWLYVLQRTLAEIMIAVEIVDRRLRHQ